ncbi:MFS general substrate transporter [Ascodesmis nigricans]|uniref:MFS general substrate transporter n=1 Tax=Ascodesmis nigricans TaxID=341454 RepID=A0A4S2MYU9_9PEZI|nr:MFS general substrate transporter [Ascodesmis nigricans]
MTSEYPDEKCGAVEEVSTSTLTSPPPQPPRTPSVCVEASTASSDTSIKSEGVAEIAEIAEAAGGDAGGAGDVALQENEHPELSRKSKTIIVLSLCLCTFLAALDQTIITTAVPVLADEFHSPSAYQWIGSSYLLGSASFLPSWGKFSDIWGRKPVLLIAATLFMIGSILCAAAQEIGLLLAGRTIQGIGAGGLLGLVNVTISDIVSIRERGLYLSYVGMTWAIASSVGPVLGGVFTGMARWGWRFCFIINIPVGLVAMTGITMFLHLHSPKLGIREGLKRVDWLGTASIVSGTVLFLVGLESGGVHHPWSSPLVLCLLIFGLLLFFLFILIEWKFAAAPIIPLRLFHERTNIFAYLVGFTHGFVFIAGCYFMPLYFQSVRGATPLLSGVYVLPYVIVLSVISGVSGIVISKTGRYQELIWAGVVVMTLGTGLYIDLDRTSNWGKLFMYQFISGVGCGPLFQSPLIAIHSTIDPRDLGTATTTFAFLRTFGTSLAISIGLVVFNNRVKERVEIVREVLPRELAEALMGGGASASIEWVKKFPEEVRIVAQDAFAYGMKGMWYFFVAIAAVAALASLGIGKHHLSKQLNSTQPARKRKGRGVEGSAEEKA